MYHQDYEREHLKDSIYLKEEEQDLYEELNNINDDFYREVRGFDDTGARHEPLPATILLEEWDKLPKPVHESQDEWVFINLRKKGIDSTH